MIIVNETIIYKGGIPSKELFQLSILRVIIHVFIDKPAVLISVCWVGFCHLD